MDLDCLLLVFSYPQQVVTFSGERWPLGCDPSVIPAGLNIESDNKLSLTLGNVDFLKVTEWIHELPGLDFPSYSKIKSLFVFYRGEKQQRTYSLLTRL